MANVDVLVDRLKDFRTRAEAKAALLEMGKAAVGPLIGALGSMHGGVRWSAASVLGQLEAKEAVSALIEAVKDLEAGSAAAEALQRITGRSFGEDYEAWKRWHETGAAGPRGPSVPGVTDADLVQEAVYNTNVSAEEKAPGYVLRVPLGDRHQDVMINFKAKDAEGTLLVVIYTCCGEASERLYEWALRQNVKMTAGAIAVADIEGKANFVVVDVWRRPAITARLLLDSVKQVARSGDQLEAALSKADRY